MATERFANDARSTLNATIDGSQTTLVVVSASSFPTSGQFRIRIDDEIMIVTSVSGTTFTVTRASEGTSGVGHTGGAKVNQIITDASLDSVLRRMAEGRLTLEAGVAVSLTDQLAKTSVLYALHHGNRLGLYDGTRWRIATFAELSVAVPATTVTPFDVFAFDNAGAPTLETTNWTNDTTRATGLVVQDGVLVKSGAVTRRYLGTCRTTGVSGQCEDSRVKRFCWNLYNQVPRELEKLEDTNTWTYSTAAYQQANAAAGNQVDLILGLASASWIELRLNGAMDHSADNADGFIAIGEDSTTVPITDSEIGAIKTSAITRLVAISCQVRRRPAIGRHFYAWLERGHGTGTNTWYGDNGLPTLYRSGLRGHVGG